MTTTTRLLGVYGLALFIMIVAWVTGADAQTTGSVHGVVSDQHGQPVPSATVSLEGLATGSMRRETSTDITGSFQQTGLAPGQYSVTANKTGSGGQGFRILVNAGGSTEVHFILEPGRSPAPWLREVQDTRASATFNDGVQATRTGDFAEAVRAFQSTLELRPTCIDCYFNMGVSYGRLDRFDESEAAFREALRIRPDYAPAYYGLANIYSRQNRTEEAAIARGEANRIGVNSLALSRARAQDALKRGIEFLNSGNQEAALNQFQAAVETDATMIEPHYWLGLIRETQGDRDAATRSFSRYLSAAPSGEHAAEARRRLADLER